MIRPIASFTRCSKQELKKMPKTATTMTITYNLMKLNMDIGHQTWNDQFSLPVNESLLKLHRAFICTHDLDSIASVFLAAQF